MTAVIYEGSTAEEQWRNDLAQYRGLRHPNVVQIYAMASSGGLHAILFHGDLIPIQDFFRTYDHSPISTAYLHGYFGVAFSEAAAHCPLSVSCAHHLWVIYAVDQTLDWWVVHRTHAMPPGTSTRAMPRGTSLYPYTISESVCRTPITYLGPDPESVIVSNLSLHHYHEICHYCRNVRIRTSSRYSRPFRCNRG
ncbi:hypothetical protein K438DRAFT_803629 [Mycena galopus ATCC 62051]|nr:hypothetical protein K438DRAFT_803629 [Mycena galopus ATCC 62051]